MQGPWYTFEEAQELLSLNRSELLHQIDTGAIRPVVTTKLRSFLVFMRDVNKQWLGLGTCHYRGCLSLHPNTITNLLENEEINLSNGSGSFLEPQKVTNWNAHYPFKQQPPFEVLKKWYGRDISDVNLSSCAVTPLPEEKDSNETTTFKMLNGLNNFIEELTSSKSNDGEKQKFTGNPNLSELAAIAQARPAMLDFKTNSLFKLEDLRIPASETKKLTEKASTAIDAEPEVQKPSLPDLDGQRINQLHQLILRALADNPEAKAKDLWRLIQNDWESDEPRYDLEGVIINMDAISIEWRSLGYTDQSLKSASFGATVSKLKKKL